MKVNEINALRIEANKLAQIAIAEHGESKKTIAKSLFSTQSLLSQALNGSGKSNSVPLLKAVIQFIKSNYINKPQESQELFLPNLVQTLDFKSSMSYIRRAIHNQEIAVLVGAAGVGKTFAIQKAAEIFPNIIYLRAEESGGLRFVLRELCEKTNVKPARSNADTIHRIIKEYEGTKMAIAIDEAHRLTRSHLESLRAFNDVGNFSLILLGTRPLAKTLVGKDRSDRQLLRRVKHFWEFLSPDLIDPQSGRIEMIEQILVEGYGLIEPSKRLIKKVYSITKGYFGDIIVYISQAFQTTPRLQAKRLLR